MTLSGFRMDGYLLVLARAALPAAGNLTGGLLAEVFEVSRRRASPRARPAQRRRPTPYQARARGRLRRTRPGRRDPGLLRLCSAPEPVTLSVLALTGGALVTVVVEEMVPEARADDTSAWGAIFLIAGFALFGSVSVYVG